MKIVLERMPAYPEQHIYFFEPDDFTDAHPNGLMLFMHGGDASTPQTVPDDVYFGERGNLHALALNYPYLIVAPGALPAIDGKRWNRVGAIRYIEAVLDYTMRRYNIDPDRIILGGYSMGGFGAYHVGQILADRFAGIWCGSGAWLQSDFRTMEGTPVYITHGKYDCASTYRGPHVEPRHHDWCGVSFARAAHELMLQYGVDHVYDEHEGGHNLDQEPSQMAAERMFAWSLRQKRNAFPRRLALVTPGGSADPDLEESLKNRWLEIDETTPGKILWDKINLTGVNVAYTLDEFRSQSYYLDRVQRPGARLMADFGEKNQVTVSAENVSRFTLRLHPVLCDVDAPLTLVINGAVQSVLPVRDDSCAPYCAKVTVEVPR